MPRVLLFIFAGIGIAVLMRLMVYHAAEDGVV
jgi:hypothetical protein